MTIEFTKRADGRTILRCVRDDGSVTWQRNENQQARFFPLHDLLHYAVETQLGFRRGFFGLINLGWDISETAGKSARGALPDETLEVEHLISSFMAEWNSSSPWSATDFNGQVAAVAESQKMPAPRTLTGDELARVRRRFSELVTCWRDLPEGETLKLEF